MAPDAHTRIEAKVLFREVNERIFAVASSFGEGHGQLLEILCECGDEACARLILIAASDYERILASPSAFVVFDGHEELDIERVTARTLDYVVVEKLDTAPPPSPTA